MLCQGKIDRTEIKFTFYVVIFFKQGAQSQKKKRLKRRNS